MDIKYILNQFGINETPISVTKITSGHINSTFLAELINRKIVIQSLNRDIFKNCADIMYNIRIINNIFEKHPESDVKAVEFYKALSGLNFIEHNNCIYRICDYIDSEKNNSPLYTGYAYGKFIDVINKSSDNADCFRTTIQDFHNYSAYFQKLINHPDCSLISRITLMRLSSLENVLSMTFNSNLTKRITHNDAKADNIIAGNTLTVIDLDTVMSGWIALDYGDTVRSFTAASLDLDTIRLITEGYAKGLENLLSSDEIFSLYYGILYVTAELAVRYYCDYIGATHYFTTKTQDMCLERADTLIDQLNFFLRYEKYIKQIIRNCF